MADAVLSQNIALPSVITLYVWSLCRTHCREFSNARHGTIFLGRKTI